MHPGKSYEPERRETYLQIYASMIQISLRIRVVFSESSLDKSGWPRVQSFFMQTTKALVSLECLLRYISVHFYLGMHVILNKANIRRISTV